MSNKNYWQQKLQSSLQQSLQTVNSTVSSISTDGAARCDACWHAQESSRGHALCISCSCTLLPTRDYLRDAPDKCEVSCQILHAFKHVIG